MHSVFRAGTNDQVAAAKCMLKALVMFCGKINENDRFTHMKQAMHTVWGSYLYGI